MNEEEIIKEAERIANLGCEDSPASIGIHNLIDLYQKEKEKYNDMINCCNELMKQNTKLSKYVEDRAKIGKDIQTYINKDFVNQEYISKDKIKSLLNKNKKAHYLLKADLQSLLEEE